MHLRPHYAITINRQFGSLGRPIARELSKLLEIEYYDRDIVDAVAKETNLPVSVVSNEEEKSKTGFFNMKFPLGRGTNDTQDKIYETQRKIIAATADRENCIIVGRCSDYVLRNHPHLIRIFIYAPYETRLKNCIEQLHMKSDAARKMIQEVDQAREAYHLRYAGYIPGDYTHNEILIDSSLLGVEGTAKYLATLIKEKYPNM